MLRRIHVCCISLRCKHVLCNIAGYTLLSFFADSMCLNYCSVWNYLVVVAAYTRMVCNCCVYISRVINAVYTYILLLWWRKQLSCIITVYTLICYGCGIIFVFSIAAYIRIVYKCSVYTDLS